MYLKVPLFFSLSKIQTALYITSVSFLISYIHSPIAAPIVSTKST